MTMNDDDYEHAYQHGREDALEEVARWMTERGYATGHGVTIGDRLEELVRQAAERARGPEINRLRTALRRIADDDVDEDIRGCPEILSGIAWEALQDSNG